MIQEFEVISSPIVTVYMPCRNYGRFLRQAIESVINQLYTEWELIIINEASEDETQNIAEYFSNLYPKQISIIKNEKPKGLQRVANDVLSVAKGKYIIRLDADDWLDEAALLIMVAKLDREPAIGMVYGNYFYTDEDGGVLGVERRYKLGEEDMAGHLPPHGACTMVRTRSLKSVGGYSEEINAQDGWELWYKLYKKVGAASLAVPVFYYRQHGNSLSRDSKRLLAARSKILSKTGSAHQGGYNISCLAVIPVRESYPGFEGVPYQNLGGMSLLERAVKVASESELITDIVVSSHSQDVLDFSYELEARGSVVPHYRRKRSGQAAPSALPMHEIMLDAANFYKEVHGKAPDIIIFLSLHALNRRSEHIDKAINVLRITEGDSVVSVQEEREPTFSHGANGLSLINPGRLKNLIYDRERLYKFNGVLLGSWFEILEAGSLLGEKISYIENSAEDSVQVKSLA